jgi:cysteine synthase A
MTRFSSILETVGNTPVVKINKLAPAGIDLYVKIEAFNPLGSVKDRLALGVIEDAEKSGKLKPGQTVIEATSGNTGIGLAMVCAAKGYPLVVTMAESFSIERRRLMRFLGAKVVLTPAPLGATGMVKLANELAEKNGWYLTRQFENEANADYHSRTTAKEILADFKGERLDYWVTGFGTGGTLKGVGRVLQKERPETKIVLAEPADAAMVTSGAKQERNDDGTPVSRHSAWKPHPIQGWSPDFIPKLTGDALDGGFVSQVVTIAGPVAMQASKDLAKREGIFVGTSAGASFAAALEVAKSAEKGSVILAMLPDTGERYLSTPLFADVLPDMNDDERAIWESTSAFKSMPAPAPAAAAASPAAPPR